MPLALPCRTAILSLLLMQATALCHAQPAGDTLWRLLSPAVDLTTQDPPPKRTTVAFGIRGYATGAATSLVPIDSCTSLLFCGALVQYASDRFGPQGWVGWENDSTCFRYSRSTDLGTTWQFIATPFLDSLAVIPRDLGFYDPQHSDSVATPVLNDGTIGGKTLFVLLKRRLYRSTDLGDSWHPTTMDTSLLRGKYAPTMDHQSSSWTVPHSIARVRYEQAPAGYRLAAATYDRLLWLSDDDGRYWNPLPIHHIWPEAGPDDYLGCVLADPKGDRLFASIYTRAGLYTNGTNSVLRRVALSSDGGTTWTTRSLPADAIGTSQECVHWLFYLPQRDALLLMIRRRDYCYTLEGPHLTPVRRQLPAALYAPGTDLRTGALAYYPYFGYEPHSPFWSTDGAITWTATPTHAFYDWWPGSWRLGDTVRNQHLGLNTMIAHDGRLLNASAGRFIQAPQRIPIDFPPLDMRLSHDTLRLSIPYSSRAPHCNVVTIANAATVAATVRYRLVDALSGDPITHPDAAGYSLTPGDSLIVLPAASAEIRICLDPLRAPLRSMLLIVEAEDPPIWNTFNGICPRRWRDTLVVIVERIPERIRIAADTTRTLRGRDAMLHLHAELIDSIPAALIGMMIPHPFATANPMLIAPTVTPAIQLHTTTRSDGTVEMTLVLAQTTPAGSYPLADITLSTADPTPGDRPYRIDSSIVRPQQLTATPKLSIETTGGLLIRDTAAVTADTIRARPGERTAFTISYSTSWPQDSTVLHWITTYDPAIFTPDHFQIAPTLSGWSATMSTIAADRLQITLRPASADAGEYRQQMILGQLSGTVAATAPAAAMALPLESAEQFGVLIAQYPGLLLVEDRPIPHVRADTISAHRGDRAGFTLRYDASDTISAEWLLLRGDYDASIWRAERFLPDPSLGLAPGDVATSIDNATGRVQIELRRPARPLAPTERLGSLEGEVVREDIPQMPLLLIEASMLSPGYSDTLRPARHPGLLHITPRPEAAVRADTIIAREGDQAGFTLRYDASQAISAEYLGLLAHYDPDIWQAERFIPDPSLGLAPGDVTTSIDNAAGRVQIELRGPALHLATSVTLGHLEGRVLDGAPPAMPLVLSAAAVSAAGYADTIRPTRYPGLLLIEQEPTEISGVIWADTVRSAPGAAMMFHLWCVPSEDVIGSLEVHGQYNPMMFKPAGMELLISGYRIQEEEFAQGRMRVRIVPETGAIGWQSWAGTGGAARPFARLHGYGYFRESLRMPLLVEQARLADRWDLQRHPGLLEVDSICGLQYRLIELSGSEYSLKQNHPNPLSPITTIEFSLGLDGATRLTIHNLEGVMVGCPVAGYLSAGTYRLEYDGSGLPSGIYTYVLHSGDFMARRKMVVAK